LRCQRGDRVDHQHVHGTGAHQHFRHLQRLLAGVRLGHDQVVDLDTELLGIDGIQGVLGVDERRGAAGLLGLGDHLQGQGGLAR
jgi:hypothetical protein